MTYSPGVTVAAGPFTEDVGVGVFCADVGVDVDVALPLFCAP
jgi:hypothetical protein